MKLQELNDDLTPVVKKILSGDVLNIPALSRQDTEKILHYCIGLLTFRIDNLQAQLEDLIDEISEPANNMEET